MKKLLILLVLWMTATLVWADSQQVCIEKANKAYTAGFYSQAADLYRKVAASGYASPELYYNLGNACFKMNDLAGAILWYERALRLDPGNEDIDFNLKIANTRIADKIEPLPEMFYKRWFTALVQFFPVDTWARTGIVFLLLAILAATLYVVSRVLVLRKAGFWTGLVLLLLSVVSLILAWQGYGRQNKADEAIVFTPTITVKSSPDEKSTDLFVVHEGTKVQLIDNISGWYEIRIVSGSVGWLPASSLEKI